MNNEDNIIRIGDIVKVESHGSHGLIFKVVIIYRNDVDNICLIRSLLSNDSNDNILVRSSLLKKIDPLLISLI